MSDPALRGPDQMTVVLPVSGESDRLQHRLQQLGVRTLACPLMSLVDAPDATALDDFITSVIAVDVDDVIFLTGEGVRRLTARAAMRGQQADFVEGLRSCRTIARGPKPAVALAALGITVSLQPSLPTSAGVAHTLRGLDLRDRRIAVQLHGDMSADVLLKALQAAGARVRTISAYTYAPAADDDRIRAAVDSLADGSAHAIAFTNAGQIDRLFEVADQRGWRAHLKAALARAHVACIGPLVAEALTDRNVSVDLTLDPPYTAFRLAEALAAANTAPK